MTSQQQKGNRVQYALQFSLTGMPRAVNLFHPPPDPNPSEKSANRLSIASTLNTYNQGKQTPLKQSGLPQKASSSVLNKRNG